MTDQSTQIPPKKISIRPHMFDSPESASLWFDIFNGVLFTGALLVTIGTWGTIRTAGIKERFSDERIAVNESETRRAIAESDIAKEGTAKANERIAELSTQAERLRKDTAEANARALEAQANLEKFRAPRLLTNEQAFALISALSSFKGHNVAVGASPQTFETASLAEQLVTVLKAAGVNASRNDGAAAVQVGLAKEVVVCATTGNDKGTQFAQQFAVALSAQGISATAIGGLLENIMDISIKQGRERNNPDFEWVVIAVGDKG